MEAQRDVVVVTGAGGMGAAVARRLGSGRTLIVADASERQLEQTVAALSDEGHAVRGVVTDVSDRVSVEELATIASGEGRPAAVVHTAGVSPATAPTEAILGVDMIGTAHVIDVFETVASGGHVPRLRREHGRPLRLTGPGRGIRAGDHSHGRVRQLDVVTAIRDEGTAYWWMLPRRCFVRTAGVGPRACLRSFGDTRPLPGGRR